MPYASDRTFTDYVHHHLAVPLIYQPLGWAPVSVPSQEAIALDIGYGIDYIFEDGNGQRKNIQERFREAKYRTYTDFTIRYRRDGNRYADRRASEFYKMKAGWFVYGITNGSKAHPEELTGFEKYAVVDLEKVYRKMEQGWVVIRDNRQQICTVEEGRLICPIKYNQDGSSSFFPVDIGLLARLWPGEMLLAQYGFV
jgi:hypothetical protein